MSIRSIANQGFSLHSILGSGDDLESSFDGADGSKSGLFNFGGRLTERLPQSTQSISSVAKEEVPELPFRLKTPLSLTPPKTANSSSTASNATTATTAAATAYRVQSLERQLHDAKERMQMLNNDRTVRVRKAEEQARKAMSEERAMRSQIENMRSAHVQEMNQMKRDLVSAEAEVKELHTAYTRIDLLEADKQSLADNAQHLTLELERLNQEYHELKAKFDNQSDKESMILALKTELDDLKMQHQVVQDENSSIKKNDMDKDRTISCLKVDNKTAKSELESTKTHWKNHCQLMESTHHKTESKLQSEIDRLKSTPPAPPVPPAPPPGASLAPTVSISTISDMMKPTRFFFPPQVISTSSQIPSTRSTTFVTHDMHLSCDLQIEGGPDSGPSGSDGDKNKAENEFIELIVGDFRSYIKPTLKRKGVDV